METPQGSYSLSQSLEPDLLLNPFPGLRPFEVSENYLFFGRDGQVDSLLEKLSENRFVAVVGTSGSGKSSLVRAGLLPALYGGFMVSAGSTWHVAVMRPGSSPIKNLAEAISEPDVFGTDDTKDKGRQLNQRTAILETSSLGLVQAVRQAALPKDENLLIVVDQFEELFRFKQNVTIADAANEAAAFVKLLLEAVRQRELSIYVLLTLRSDFLGDCAQFRDLPETINEGHYLIPRLTREQQREVILGPVAVGGGKISPRLVQQLLNDLGDSPDQLPILQHALMRSWDKWQTDHEEGGPIDIKHYEAIGKMSHALSEHADEAYNELPDDRSRKICEMLFKCLTMRGPDNRGIRRPTKIRDICAIADATPEEVIRVVEYFRKTGRSFIMPPHTVELHPDTVLDISHESLMRVWDRLVEWVNDDADSADMYLRLVGSYELHEKEQAGFWRDPELQQALNWQKKHHPNAAWAFRFSPAFTEAMGFLDDSLLWRKREEREARRRKGIFNAFIAAFLAFACVLTVWALSERSSATTSAEAAIVQGKNAEAQKKIAENEKQQAEQSAVIAQEQEQKAEAAKNEADKQRKFAELQSLEALIQKQKADVSRSDAEQASLMANEQRAAALRQSQVADSLKDMAEHSAQAVSRLRLLSIAKALAIKAEHLQTNDRELVSLLALQAYQFSSNNGGASMEPDVYGALNRANRLVNADRLTLSGQHSGNVRSVAYLKSGDVISSGSDGKVIRWKRGGTSEKLAQSVSGIRTIAVSPDERFLCYTGNDSVMHLYEFSSGKHTIIHTGISHITQAAFISDQTLVVLNNTGDLEIASASQRTPIVSNSVSKVKCFALNSASKLIAAGFEDGSITIWDAASPNAPIRSLAPANASVIDLCFSPNGDKLAGGTENGLLCLWEAGLSGAKPRTISTNGSPLRSVAYSPDGDQIAAGSSDGKIRIWNPEKLGELPLTVAFDANWIWQIAFNNNGSELAAASSDHSVQLIPTHASSLIEQITPRLRRNLNKKEWDEYIGNDIPYMKTLPDLSSSSE